MQAAGREDQRVAAGEDDFADFRVGGDIGVGGGQFGIAQQAAIGADLFAAEAEAAIDRAGEQGLEQRPVRIAVDDAGDGGERFVGDRVRIFVRGGDQLGGIGDELQADRIGG